MSARFVQRWRAPHALALVACAALSVSRAAAAGTPGTIEIDSGPDAQTLVRGDEPLTAWPMGAGTVPLVLDVDGPTWFEVTVHRLDDGGSGPTRVDVQIERDGAARSITERTFPAKPRAVSATPVQLHLEDGTHRLSLQVSGDDTVPIVVTVDTRQKPKKGCAAAPEEPALSALGGPDLVALAPLVPPKMPMPPGSGEAPAPATLAPKTTEEQSESELPDEAGALDLPAVDTRPPPKPAAEVAAARPPPPMPRPRARPLPPPQPTPSPEETGEDWSGRAPGAGNLIGLGLRAGFVRPSANVDLAPIASLELRWQPARTGHVVGVALEAGYRTIAGSGVARATAPRAPDYAFSWRTQDLPCSLGLVVEPPFGAWSDGWPSWLSVYLGAGGAAQLTWSHADAGGVASHGTSHALGGYAAAGGEVAIGWRHRLQLEYRETLLRTDFGDAAHNAGSGDVGGANVLAGYRYVF